MTTQYYIYILSNFKRNVLYTGVSNNLTRRVWEHKQGLAKGFTQKYKLHYLVYYEVFNDPKAAIEREKQIKSWSRNSKDKLILKSNPSLEDLYEKIT